MSSDILKKTEDYQFGLPIEKEGDVLAAKDRIKSTIEANTALIRELNIDGEEKQIRINYLKKLVDKTREAIYLENEEMLLKLTVAMNELTNEKCNLMEITKLLETILDRTEVNLEARLSLLYVNTDACKSRLRVLKDKISDDAIYGQKIGTLENILNQINQIKKSENHDPHAIMGLETTLRQIEKELDNIDPKLNSNAPDFET